MDGTGLGAGQSQNLSYGNHVHVSIPHWIHFPKIFAWLAGFHHSGTGKKGTASSEYFPAHSRQISPLHFLSSLPTWLLTVFPHYKGSSISTGLTLTYLLLCHQHLEQNWHIADIYLVLVFKSCFWCNVKTSLPNSRS